MYFRIYRLGNHNNLHFVVSGLFPDIAVTAR